MAENISRACPGWTTQILIQSTQLSESPSPASLKKATKQGAVTVLSSSLCGMARGSCGKAHATCNFSALSGAGFRASAPKVTAELERAYPQGYPGPTLPLRSKQRGSPQVSPPPPTLQQAYRGTAVTIIHNLLVLLTVLNI